MHPVSSMVLLPDITGDEHRGGKTSVTSSIARPSQQHGHAPLSTDMSRSSRPEDGHTTRAANPPKMAACGRRVVMAAGTLDNRGETRDSATTPGLCLLEHGFGLDATEEGGIGLPEGSTLFAQPLVLEGADRPINAQSNRPLDHNGSDTDIGGGNTSQTDRQHVLLLSDRVRSKTHVLGMPSCGEVAPVVSGVSGCDRMYNSSYDGTFCRSIYYYEVDRTPQNNFFTHDLSATTP